MQKAPRKLHFTKAAIESLKVPTDRREYHYDEKQPGLAVCITPAGSRTFYVVRRVGMDVERVKIGKWPEYSVEHARNEAAKITGVMAGGVNPNDKRRVAKSAQLLGELFERFLELPTRKKNKRPRTAITIKNYRQTFNSCLTEWSDRRISTISKVEIERLHNRLGKERGIYVANRTLEILRAMFYTAIDLGEFDHNPAARLNKFEEESRERFLHADELPKFFKALDKEPSEKIRDFIKVLLFVGQRRGNTLAMKWDEISFERGEWEIPRTKSGKPHKVPLPLAALEILKRRFDANEKLPADEKSEYVFPGLHGHGHLKDPMGAWRKILSRAGIKDLRLHDLRRSCGSWQAATGASLSIIGKSLGHSRPETTAIYSRLELSPVRVSMEAATQAMLAAAKPGKPSKRKAK